MLLDQISLPLPGLSKGPSRNLAALLAGAPFPNPLTPVMAPDIVLGLILGGSIGLTNAAVSYGLYRLVRNRPNKTFYRVILLGMLGRLGGALVLVALVLAFVPVHFLAFTGALLTSVVVGLITETLLIHRGQMRHADRAAASPQTSL